MAKFKLCVVLVVLLTLLVFIPGVSANDIEEVTIDVMPGSQREPINLKSQGVMAIAVDGTPFVDDITGEVEFEKENVKLGLLVMKQDNWYVNYFEFTIQDVTYKDVDIDPCCKLEIPKDGVEDITIKFKKIQLSETWDAWSEELCTPCGNCKHAILFEYEDGVNLVGCDGVRIVGPVNPKPV